MTKKLSKEKYVAKLKRELYPIAIKENQEKKMRCGERMGQSINFSTRALIAEKGQRIFLEYGSYDGKLRLIDFRDLRYKKDETEESLFPLCNLVKDATYDTNEKGEITKIYLGIEDSLVAPFRCGIDELEKEVRKEIIHAHVWKDKVLSS